MIGILTAVREELTPILKKMPSVDQESAGGSVFYRGQIAGREAVLARSGMGEERARLAARLMIERYPLDLLLAVGFAGGLSPEVGPGDLVVATSVGSRIEPEHELLERSRAVSLVGGAIHFGPLYTAAHIIHSVDQKRALATTCDAIALDMESAGIAQAAAAAGVPWLAVRAVTDGLSDALPELREPFRGLPAVDPGTGDVIPLRMAVLLLFCPRVVPNLVQLGGRASRAARNLAAFVESYVAGLDPAFSE